MKRQAYIVLLMLVVCITGCRDDSPLQKVGMPVSICLPANEVQSAIHAPRRVMGDPGTTETFLFPHYLYIIVMKKEEGESWKLWQTISRTLTDNDWEPTSYVGLLPTMEDSIYQYKEQIDLLLSSGKRFDGRVYAIASAVELTFNKSLNEITNMDDLLTLSFNTSSPTVQQNLQHIYISPYNLTLFGEYFGAFSSNQRVPHVELLLYHVAAKVDITWIVDEDKRINKITPSEGIRLTRMKACNLFNGNAYCFRPMRNEVATAPLTSGDTIELVSPADEGLWWEGRSYFYTIPYVVTGAAIAGTVYFPLQMLMETNGSGDEYKPTLNMPIDTTQEYAPWMRANFNISTRLEAKTETKIVE